jgi:hypothetical protein
LAVDWERKLRVESSRLTYDGRALTNGKPGGNEPTGNLAERSPDLSNSAASRNAARKRPYASRSPFRIALLAAWNRG